MVQIIEHMDVVSIPLIKGTMQSLLLLVGQKSKDITGIQVMNVEGKIIRNISFCELDTIGKIAENIKRIE
jgi:hypothetical protein